MKKINTKTIKGKIQYFIRGVQKALRPEEQDRIGKQFFKLKTLFLNAKTIH